MACRMSVERDADGHALRHLDPVAVGILGREERESLPVPAPMLWTCALKSVPG